MPQTSNAYAAEVASGLNIKRMHVLACINDLTDVYANKVGWNYVSGAVTSASTTSTTPVSVGAATDLTLVKQRAGSVVLIFANVGLLYTNSGAGASGSVDVYVDGATSYGVGGNVFATVLSTAGPSAVIAVTGLTAGSHTFKLRMVATGGTVNVANARLMAVELL